uniref:Uncharacterized protein LOC114912598 n=2 Tax=Elaeis guineensis var. tenera TaxID=51953 RepID=A0A8N4IA85_ELAGV|nr:uncharacterized protein LOC114912598 [Elaeis guineensis]
MDNSIKRPFKNSIPWKSSEEVILGELGEMMVAMLPNDLPFTIFVPSEEAFERVLKLRASDSLTEQKINDTYATISRIMGFSAVPQHLPSGAVPLHKEKSFDSISGFRLYAWKDVKGNLVVNGVRSVCVDVRKAEIVAHIMSGVIMDAEFEQSFSSDYD